MEQKTTSCYDLTAEIVQIKDCVDIWNGFGIVDVRNLSALLLVKTNPESAGMRD